jgi:magnesium chelatase accessory protein
VRGLPGHLFAPLARLFARAGVAARFFAWRARDPAVIERLLGSTGSSFDSRSVELYGRLARHPGHVAAALNMMANWDLDGLAAELPSLAPALLLVAGGDDRTVPPETSRRVARKLPASRYVELAGLGHLAHEEDAHRVAGEIRRFAGDLGIVPAG